MLYTHQKEMVEFVRSHGRAMCICPCGAGKTRAMLAAFTRAFVVAPLRVATMVWPEEAEAVGKKCAVITGKKINNPSADFYTTNFENAHNIKNFCIPENMYTLIIDESSKLKSFQFRQGGVRAKMLREFAAKFKRVVLLTGTPCSESLGDLYSQISFLDGGETFGRSKLQFMQRYHIDLSRSPKFHKWAPLAGAKEDVLKACEKYCKYFEPSIKTFGKSEQTIYYKLGSNIKDSLRVLKETQLLHVGDNICYACNRAVLSSRLLQAASGFYYTDNGGVEWGGGERIDVLIDLLDEINEKCVIVAYWRASCDAIIDRCNDITRDISAFKSGRFKHLLINPAAAGHGLSLQHETNHMIIYEPFFSCEQYEQVLERMGERRQAQSGLNRVAYYHYIISDCGPDRAAYDALQKKADAEEAVLEYFKNLARHL